MLVRHVICPLLLIMLLIGEFQAFHNNILKYLKWKGGNELIGIMKYVVSDIQSMIFHA